ncbi:MAG: hypothetical protein A3I89_00820 [Candidatus Harrisonbacteria bacterium RIFCSPLOWO2_02_FULL_41_11]|nr:MAG: hypothetical protein A3I89_00820 [Candidatus Harrisonbacteria bacterium RIFCSPLOWO2_02_FULL_41_11]
MAYKYEKLEKLSDGDVKAFFKITEFWGLTEREQTDLLGKSDFHFMILKGFFKKLAKGNFIYVKEDIYKRITCVIDIYVALIGIFGLSSQSANAWIKKPNDAPFLKGKTALQFMISEGAEGMKKVYNYLRGAQ